MRLAPAAATNGAPAAAAILATRPRSRCRHSPDRKHSFLLRVPREWRRRLNGLLYRRFVKRRSGKVFGGSQIRGKFFLCKVEQINLQVAARVQLTRQKVDTSPASFKRLKLRMMQNGLDQLADGRVHITEQLGLLGFSRGAKCGWTMSRNSASKSPRSERPAVEWLARSVLPAGIQHSEGPVPGLREISSRSQVLA